MILLQKISVAKLVSPSANKENCGEVKTLISHFQSIKVICPSAVKICGLEILPGAANLDSYMRGTVKTHVSLSSGGEKTAP